MYVYGGGWGRGSTHPRLAWAGSTFLIRYIYIYIYIYVYGGGVGEGGYRHAAW
jgi:hypothetical protein